MYKLMYIYRMCGPQRWSALKQYLITTSNGVRCRNNDGIVTPAIKKEGTGLDEDIISWGVGADNPINILFNNFAANGATFGEEFYEADPFNANYIADDYWVYGGNNWIIPSNSDNTIGVDASTAIGIAFQERVEDSVTSETEAITATNVLKYLLGIKSNQMYSFDNKLRVLEIQPCNSFTYDSLDKINELGSALLRTNGGNWESIEESQTYLSFDYVTPNELNCIKDDIASHYDVVIVGDNTDMLTREAIKEDDIVVGYKTIYNDRNLNGYVYLAFGDLFKMSTNMMGSLPDEYIQVTYDSNIKDTNNKTLISIDATNAAGTSLWSPFVQSRLSQIDSDGYFIYQDLYKYYKTYVSERYTGSGATADYLADADGVIDNEEFYMDYYLGNSRMPDNDISDITKEKLREFVKTGNPIIVADSVYNADRTKLYPTSDMYDFAKTILRDSNDKLLKNVVKQDAIGRSVAFLGAKVPEIEFKKGQVEYYTKTDQTTTVRIEGENKTYFIYNKETSLEDLPIKPVDPVYTRNDNANQKHKDGVVNRFNSKKLHYSFTVTGEINATYKIKLLIDRNNDGVYTENSSNPKENELYYAENITLRNTRKADHSITCQLSNDFRGMLSWKIVVVKLDGNRQETVYRVEEKGYSAIFRGDEAQTPYVITDNDLEEIDVLQIYPGSTSLDLTGDTFNNLFTEVKETVGYSINVTKVSISDFNDWYEDAPYVKGSSTMGYQCQDYDHLKGYEMVICGFKDSFNHKDISNDYGALDNLIDFVYDGKALLLTHDTLSWRTAPNYVAGYIKQDGTLETVNSDSMASVRDNGDTIGTGDLFRDTSPTLTFMLRNRAGMDKYGVTLLPESEDSNGKEDPGDKNIYRYGKEVPMYEAVDSSDTVYRPSYMTTDEVREIQGFNTWMIWRKGFTYRHLNYYPSSNKGNNYYRLRPYSDGFYIYYSRNENNAEESTQNWTSTKALCLNEGPVTMYPFEVGNEITVNYTHAQYFELDVEDEEVVVWYSLVDDTTTSNSDFYAASDMDGANNYYIYSKGNITYSGAGHEAMSDVSTEYKLFVNTIVKAIAGCGSKSSINVTNGSSVGVNNYIVYVDSTYSAKDYTIGFNATDADLISLEMANNNIDLVGTFEKAEIWWWNPDSAAADKWELIKDKDYQAKRSSGESITTDQLKNGVQQNLTLANTNLNQNQAKLDRIEQLVEVDDTGAKFRILVADDTGESVSVEITLRVRDLFNLN